MECDDVQTRLLLHTLVSAADILMAALALVLLYPSDLVIGDGPVTNAASEGPKSSSRSEPATYPALVCLLCSILYGTILHDVSIGKLSFQCP